jgi:hypothetical protein
MSPLSLSTRNIPPPSPANSSVFFICIILPSKVSFIHGQVARRISFAGAGIGCVGFLPTQRVYLFCNKKYLERQGGKLQFFASNPASPKKRSMLTFPREWVEGDHGQLRHILCILE